MAHGEKRELAIRVFDKSEYEALEPNTQHNIMMLVGNGFDISVLQMLNADYLTSYTSFFYFLKSQRFNEQNVLFQQMDTLRLKHEQSLENGENRFANWSDFESILQDLLASPNAVSRTNLHADVEELQQAFSKFLDVVVSPELLNELDKQARKYEWATRTFARFLADLDPAQYSLVGLPRKVDHFHLFNFNIINFNYTFLLDNYLYLDRDQFDPHPHSGSDRNFDFRRNPRDYSYSPGIQTQGNARTGCSSYLMTEVHHPHGIQPVPRSLLFGIDANDYVAERGSNAKLEKPFWAQTPRKFRKMIAESELFIVFGSSLGATDRWWWRHILAAIRGGSELIIYVYSPNESASKVESRVKSRFISENFDSELFGGQTLEGPELFEELSTSIHVVVYKDSSTLSAFGFGKDGVDPTHRDPTLIPPLV